MKTSFAFVQLFALLAVFTTALIPARASDFWKKEQETKVSISPEKLEKCINASSFYASPSSRQPRFNSPSKIEIFNVEVGNESVPFALWQGEQKGFDQNGKLSDNKQGFYLLAGNSLEFYDFSPTQEELSLQGAYRAIAIESLSGSLLFVEISLAPPREELLSRSSRKNTLSEATSYKITDFRVHWSSDVQAKDFPKIKSIVHYQNGSIPAAQLWSLRDTIWLALDEVVHSYSDEFVSLERFKNVITKEKFEEAAREGGFKSSSNRKKEAAAALEACRGLGLPNLTTTDFLPKSSDEWVDIYLNTLNGLPDLPIP